MPKYINFDIAARKLGTWYNDLAEANGSDDDFVKGYGEAMDDLADVPAADVQEVKHAKWIQRGEDVICSNCGQLTEDRCIDGDNESGYYTVLPHYCSACGARMLEEKNADRY